MLTISDLESPFAILFNKYRAYLNTGDSIVIAHGTTFKTNFL